MDGYLADKGLIPLSSEDRKIVRTNGEQLEPLSM